MDPRTPVLVGVGQVTHRADDVGEASPLGLMTAAARAAEADSGAAGLLQRTQSVGVVDLLSWTVPDPAAKLAAELGISPRETVTTARGGTSPILLLGALASDIRDGKLDVALIAGGEAGVPFMRAMRSGTPTGWPEQPDATEPTRKIGVDRDPHHPAEFAAGLIAPVFWYPVFEQSLRSATGRTPAEHTEHIARIWARFAAVAAGNPHAWTRTGPDAATIAAATPENRMVSAPYTKLMNANLEVDQGAAMILCSTEAAQAAGIPSERWVFVNSTALAHDHWFPGERDELHRSPAIAAVGEAVLGHAGAGIDDVALLDLYSCFPVAVQIAAQELGVDLLDDGRAPTVTGGLAFAGGPANNYVMHSLATLAERIREQPDAKAMATAVGWYMTKHGAAVLSGTPPEQPFRSFDVQAAVDPLPRRELTTDAVEAPVEAYTTLYSKDGTPGIGIVSALLADGRRALAKSQDADVLEALLSGDPLGITATLDGAAGFTLD